MTKHSPIQYCGIVVVAFIAVVHSTAAAVFPITFEGPGYTAGNLKGQGSTATKWIASPVTSTTLNVTAGVGRGNTNGLLSSHPSSASESYLFTPSSTDLPDFIGTQSLVDFSFQYRYYETPKNGGSTNDSVVVNLGYLSTGSAARLFISRSGILRYSNAATNSNTALDASGAVFTVTDTATWVTVSGQLNYAEKTFTLLINGIEQGSGVLGFQNTNSNTLTMRLGTVYDARSEFPYVPIVFDNINYSVVPEPSSTVLLGLAATACLIFGRKIGQIRRAP